MKLKAGQRWLFHNESGRTEVYVIDEVVGNKYVALSHDNGAKSASAYPLKHFSANHPDGKPIWTHLADPPCCPQCEKRPPLEPDYLCHECRYGV